MDTTPAQSVPLGTSEVEPSKKNQGLNSTSENNRVISTRKIRPAFINETDESLVSGTGFERALVRATLLYNDYNAKYTGIRRFKFTRDEFLKYAVSLAGYDPVEHFNCRRENWIRIEKRVAIKLGAESRNHGWFKNA